MNQPLPTPTQPLPSRPWAQPLLPLPNLYIEVGRSRGCPSPFRCWSYSSTLSRGWSSVPSDDERYESWQSDALIDLESTRGGQSKIAIALELRQPTVGRTLFGGDRE
jgi:hypothetical protein